MNLETSVEYFYGDKLRLSFGFENPNKAAVIFTCLIPLLWWLWQTSWRLKNYQIKIPTLLFSAGLIGGAWYCLMMTFSRGGLVATMVGLMYLIVLPIFFKKKLIENWYRNAEVIASFCLLIVFASSVIWSGLGLRSSEALGNDASVGNRIELWNGALQMAAENIRGFGTGESGEQYMQWYQPIERHEGYRTMVNSYLTFLVEQGWALSIGALLLFVLFWVWTKPNIDSRVKIALRGSIICFLVAGIFSTTIEDVRLWVLPIICGISLMIFSIKQKQRLEIKPLLFTGMSIFICCVILFLIGFRNSKNDPLRREFGQINGKQAVVAVSTKISQSPSLGCFVDEAVMGNQYQKLLRRLALGAEIQVLLGERAKKAEQILCVGKEVHSAIHFADKKLWLLSPEEINDSELKILIDRKMATHLILPEIDEDGRVSFWEDVADEGSTARLKKSSLTGVGNRADWAWSEVIKLIVN
jgi:O-Antigen ligase